MGVELSTPIRQSPGAAQAVSGLGRRRRAEGRMPWRYVLRRLGHGAIVVLVAYTATFVILYLLPGDPLTIMLDGQDGSSTKLSEEQLQNLRVQYGLDQPPIVQYFTMLGGVLTGDLGVSIQHGRPVWDLVLAALPQTLILAFWALVTSILLGMSIAALAAYTDIGWLRRLLNSIPPLFNSIPSFWIALLLLQVFSFTFPVFPATGNGGIESLVLPVIALAIGESAVYAQVFYRSLQNTLREPYVEVLVSRGLSKWYIFRKHAFRNASLPLLTLVGMSVGDIFAGSVIIETVFSRNGIGRLTQSAVATQDIPVIQAVVLISAIVYAVVMIGMDLLYPVVDPRIDIRQKAAA